MSRFITVADPNPGWKAPLITGWAGMRGVVSLAMALSIPLFISEGQSFPYRNLILFITFIVILVTLVLQGLTLPWLIRKVKLEDRFSPYSEEKQELIIQKKIAQASLQFLEQRFDGKQFTNEHIEHLYKRLSLERKVLEERLNEEGTTRDEALKDHQTVYLEMLEHQRYFLNDMNQRSEFNEELIRKYLSLIDVEEFRLREKRSGKEEDELI
jgi:CPA1 family monovalent cation:H+ antiporter